MILDLLRRCATPKNALKRPETPQLAMPTIFAKILTTPEQLP
jgi:hypothetical protein